MSEIYAIFIKLQIYDMLFLTQLMTINTEHLSSIWH